MTVSHFLTQSVRPPVLYSHHRHKAQVWGLTGAFGHYTLGSRNEYIPEIKEYLLTGNVELVQVTLLMITFNIELAISIGSSSTVRRSLYEEVTMISAYCPYFMDVL
jgi:hypothetical protein